MVKRHVTVMFVVKSFIRLGVQYLDWVCGIRVGAQCPNWRYLGTTVPGYHGTWVQRYLGTKVPGYHGAFVPRYLGTTVPRYMPRYHGVEGNTVDSVDGPG